MPTSTYLKKAYKSPFLALNVHHHGEPLGTDMVYVNTSAITSGAHSAQFFVGLNSQVADIYGMKTDKQFVNTLLDNIRTRGAPTKLISDRAQVQISNKVKDILCYYMIGDWQSEPHHQNQNPTEHSYQNIKCMANILLDRTGAPASYWLLAMQLSCFIHNHVTLECLGWITPIAALTGITPDISPLLTFEFYEPVYYKLEEPGFPSQSREGLARFAGIAEHVGHAMTFKLITDDTHQLITRSEIRTARDPTSFNRCLPIPEAIPPPDVAPVDNDDELPEVENPVIYSFEPRKNGEPIQPPPPSLITVDPKVLISHMFLLPQGGNPQDDDDTGLIKRARIIEAIDDHMDKTNTSPDLIQFRCSINDDEFEEILTYNQIMEHLTRDEENPIIWKYKKIVAHQGPLQPNHPDYKGSKYKVRVKWENGEITDEPLGIIAADDLVACAHYAHEKGLLYLPGWRQFQKIAKHEKVLK